EKFERVRIMIDDAFGCKARIGSEDSGRYLRLTLDTDMTSEKIAQAAKTKSLLISPIADSGASFIISYYGVPDDELKAAFAILADIIE
ncbi:MAG: hypothetical protein ACI396_02985, partial [Acutalibacteraceae bacterium]